MTGTYDEYESFKRAAFALSAAVADGYDEQVAELVAIYVEAREAWIRSDREVDA